MWLLFAGLALAALTAWAVWRAAGRLWHYFAIAALAVPVMPLLLSTVTGDVSRYLPDAMFSDGADGKDQIILASIAATVLLALLIAACAFGLARAAWQAARRERA